MTAITFDPFVPMPDTHHPSIPLSVADSIRESGHPSAYMMNARPMRASWSVDEPVVESATSIVHLRGRKISAPAPFVGDPRVEEAAYIWHAWVDDAGRYVCGSAELRWRHIY